MTVRAIITGLLGAAFIAGVAYFNDNLLRQSLLIGNHMPHSVYGTLILILLVVNPVLRSLRRRWAFSGRELAVVLALTLAACAIPAAGLMRFFTNAVMLPQHKAMSRPGWQSEHVVEMVPPRMLAGTPARLRPQDIADPVAIGRELTVGDALARLPAPKRRIRDCIPKAQLTRLAAALDGSESVDREQNCRQAVADALNHVLRSRRLYDPAAFRGMVLPKEALLLLDRERELEAIRTDTPKPKDNRWPERIRYLDAPHLEILNRHFVDAVWPEAIHSHSDQQHDELEGFLQGLSRGPYPVSLRQVPWSAWRRPLAFWLPLFLFQSVGLIGLALVVHRQWSLHERLPYPITRFADALLPSTDPGRPSVLRHPLFLGTLGVVLAIHAVNCASIWWPDILIPVRTSFDFSALQGLFPFLSGPVTRWALFTVRIYLAVVGMAYLVASDVSFSLGIAPVLAACTAGLLTQYGISLGGRGLYSGSPIQTFGVGAYLGILFMVLYTGRRYYWSVARSAVGLKPGDEVPGEATWGARIAGACGIAFATYLAAMGIGWWLAILYTLIAAALFTVMSRVLAETGLFFLEPRWFPCAFLIAVFGIEAVGPSTALLMFLVSTVLLVVPREALMPFVVNSFALLDRRRVNLGPAAAWCAGAVVLALLIAVPVTLMWQYGAGTHHWDGWGTGAVPRYSFDKTVEHKQHLEARGTLSASENAGPTERLAMLSPDWPAVTAFGIGVGIVVLLATARLRWAWWPLHPVLLVGVWNYPCIMFWHSFLLGWLIKSAVVKYGGDRLYRRLLPAAFGLIAGDLLGTLIPAIIGAAYYFISGHAGPAYMVLPD